jgi:bifunctional pyridoxal-dependent enzyme with beta-cystathionase and maltose regulon repressor activities
MSASKTFNFPAAGCAWAIIEDDRLRQAFAADIAAHVLHSPSVFGYDATLAAFRGGDAWLTAQLEYLRGNRDEVERTMAAAGLPTAHVEATYLAWVDASSLNAKDAYRLFLEAGVALSPGPQFGGSAGFVRLNFATQRARLAEALARMRAAAARPAPR